jgi:hypothetical protein
MAADAHGRFSRDATMRTWVLLTGAGLIVAGLIVGIAFATNLAHLNAQHDTECGTPSSTPPAEACRLLASDIHLQQAFELIGFLVVGTGGGILIAEYLLTRPAAGHFDRRIPAFRRREILTKARQQRREAPR